MHYARFRDLGIKESFPLLSKPRKWSQYIWFGKERENIYQCGRNSIAIKIFVQKPYNALKLFRYINYLDKKYATLYVQVNFKNYEAKERHPHWKIKPHPPSSQCITPAAETFEPKKGIHTGK